MAENNGRILNTVKIAVQVSLSVILAVLTVLVVYIMVFNMRGKAATVFGTSVLKVVTGSMEPSIHSGDYIMVSSDYIKLNEGDIICFYSEDSAIYGMLNTHRIVRINDDGSYVTKGDANIAEDPVAVTEDAIIGKYIGKVRFLRWINSFASVKKLIFAAVVIVMTAMALYEVRTIAKVTMECKQQKESREDVIRRAIDEEKQRLYAQGYNAEGGESTDESREDNEG